MIKNIFKRNRREENQEAFSGWYVKTLFLGGSLLIIGTIWQIIVNSNHPKVIFISPLFSASIFMMTLPFLWHSYKNPPLPPQTDLVIIFNKIRPLTLNIPVEFLLQ